MRPPLTTSYWPARDEGFVLEDETVGDLLLRAAAESPERVAFVAGTADPARRIRLTYRELLDEVAPIAGAIAARFDVGERLAVWAANGPRWTMLELASGLAGTVLVPINPGFRRAEAEYMLRHSGAAGLVFDQEVRGNPIGSMVRELRSLLPGLRHTIDIEADWSAFAGSGVSGPLPSVAPDAPILLQYTSGTTGPPKGAVLHHRGLANKCRIAVSLMDLGPYPVWLNVMPLFHIGGCGLSTIGPLALQGTHVLVERFDPALVFQLVESERATFLGGVPTMLLSLLDHPSFATADLSSLRSVLSGGAAVAPELVRRIEAALGVRFMVAFGQTEAHGHICQTRPSDRAEDKAETVGQALPHVALRIVDPDGNVVAPGVAGELCARSPFVMLRYHDMVEATAAAIDGEGFLHTGDLCTMDERGYVRFVGRRKEMIVRGGENISPKEIEDVLFTHPAVADVAVIGVPHPRYGEEVAAFVRLRDHVTADELRGYTRDRLAPFKCPVHWRFVDEFPVTGSGKVQKFALREQFLAEG